VRVPEDFDPTRLVDAWPLPGLSAEVCKKIKAKLLKAHAAYIRTPIDPYGFIGPLQQAFGDVAQVLFEADLLTVGLLKNQLRLFVVEAAIAGGWYRLANDEPLTELFLEYWGHPSAWREFNEKFERTFSAEIAEWSAKLLESELEGTRKESERRGPLPSAKILGANINDWVAWDGERYVLRPTKDSVLADEGLRLIGSARELSRPQPMSPGYVHVCFSQGIDEPQTPTKERFRPLDDAYQVIEFDGKQYELTPTQSTIIRVLHKANLEKRSSVGIKEIQKELRINSGKMSSWFRDKKNKRLYGTLVLQTAYRNHYRLEI
jgi:hypothetical protein